MNFMRKSESNSVTPSLMLSSTDCSRLSPASTACSPVLQFGDVAVHAEQAAIGEQQIDELDVAAAHDLALVADAARRQHIGTALLHDASRCRRPGRNRRRSAWKRMMFSTGFAGAAHAVGRAGGFELYWLLPKTKLKSLSIRMVPSFMLSSTVCITQPLGALGTSSLA